MTDEYESFIGMVRNTGGEGTSMEITIDKKIADFIGLLHGDTVKVMIKKVPQEIKG